MDKKKKPQRRKNLSDEEMTDVTPRGASFDTDEGRDAQGMRHDLGPNERESPSAGEAESAMGGASDASSGGGAGAGIPDPDTAAREERVNKGDVEEDRKKVFPEAKTKRQK